MYICIFKERRETDIELPSSGSLPKCLQNLMLCRAKPIVEDSVPSFVCQGTNHLRHHVLSPRMCSRIWTWGCIWDRNQAFCYGIGAWSQKSAVRVFSLIWTGEREYFGSLSIDKRIMTSRWIISKIVSMSTHNSKCEGCCRVEGIWET